MFFSLSGMNSTHGSLTPPTKGSCHHSSLQQEQTEPWYSALSTSIYSAPETSLGTPQPPWLGHPATPTWVCGHVHPDPERALEIVR